jgi:hypothetical protein
MTGFGSLPLPPTTDTELFCASMNQGYIWLLNEYVQVCSICVYEAVRMFCVRRVVGGERARGYCYEAEPMSMMRYDDDVYGIASGTKVGSV